jgi:3-hydroxyisobutyrate dehydrogenase-like beta-hydroxyacid dehydrogenase
MKLGIIGIGGMGVGIAKNLLKTGCEVLGYDKKFICKDNIRRLGVFPVTSIDEIQKNCSIVFLSLPDTETVKQTIFGNGGLVELGFKGTIIDTGTTHPIFTVSAAKKLITHKITFIDSPVSGLESKASTGELTSMVGASDKSLGIIKKFIESYSKTVVILNEVGHGQLSKMLNNVLYNISCAAVAEILTVAENNKMNLDGFYEIVCNSTGNSRAFEIFVPLIRQGLFEPGGKIGAGLSLEKAFKDMEAFKNFTQDISSSVPVSNACFETYVAALDKGLGNKNKGAMARVWHEWPEK